MNKGAIIVARQVLESDIWTDKPAWWFKVWVYILSRVNYSDNGQFQRGQQFFTLDEIHHGCHLSKEGIKVRSVHNVCRWLRERQMLTTQKTTRGFIISVTNYDKYQDLTGYGNDTENAKLTTSETHRNDTIIEEGKVRKKGTTKSFEERVSDFKEEVMTYSDKYTLSMLEAFFVHWSEPNGNHQMLYQLKKTWSTAGRLSTWCRNQRAWHNEENELSKMQPTEHIPNPSEAIRG